MNEQASMPAQPGALESAFTTLRTYDAGSPRGALCPIDEAVAGSFKDPKAQADLEKRLAALLKEKPSSAAVEYICSKLNLIGSAGCIPALLELLKDPAGGTTARNVLEKIQGDAPGKALRKALPQLGGAEKTGFATRETVVGALLTTTTTGGAGALR